MIDFRTIDYLHIFRDFIGRISLVQVLPGLTWGLIFFIVLFVISMVLIVSLIKR